MKNMMTLMEFFDSADLPNKDQNLGIKRVNMPQIETNQFLADVEKHPDINYTKDVVDTDQLLPTQSQFNDGKVKAIVMALRSGAEQKPIIVTEDNYIVDGHHRWAAHDNIGAKIPVLKVGTDINSLLEFLKDKPYVVRKTINESVNIDNMKRQLIDILRLRVQKSCPISSLGYSMMLQQETQKVIDMPDDQVTKEYNQIFVNNDVSPVS